LISEAILLVELALHRRLGFDRERSSRAILYKVTADAIAETGNFGTPLYHLAAKAAKSGLEADEARYRQAHNALPINERVPLFATLQDRLARLRQLNSRRRTSPFGR
jgi:hypothetical protein